MNTWKRKPSHSKLLKIRKKKPSCERVNTFLRIKKRIVKWAFGAENRSFRRVLLPVLCPFGNFSWKHSSGFRVRAKSLRFCTCLAPPGMVWRQHGQQQTTYWSLHCCAWECQRLMSRKKLSFAVKVVVFHFPRRQHGQQQTTYWSLHCCVWERKWKRKMLDDCKEVAFCCYCCRISFYLCTVLGNART